LYSYLQGPKDIVLKMQVTHLNNKPFKPINSLQVQSAIALLNNARYIVCCREDKITSSNPNAPFITSTLQQAASTRLGYSVKQTMLVAQRLYEAGYITYMRTDSTKISDEAINIVRNYILDIFGSKYLPNQPNQYLSKKNSLEAHEAIRPSNLHILAEQLENIEEDARKLYQLIWRQFVSSQMMPTQYNYTKINVIAGDFQLSTTGRTLHFDGWSKVMPILHKENEESICQSISVGQILSLQQLISQQNFTKPPLRYTEASLVKELEKRRIGRPSTYMSIIDSIQDRGYVKLNNHRFYAKKIGQIVTDRLAENFSELMNYDFTANMEDTLDKVATNQQDWKNVLDTFFIKLNQQLEKAKKSPTEGGMLPNSIVTTSINCPICGRMMGICTANTGVFLSCSGYKLPPKERCKHTINLISESEWLKKLDNENKSIDTQKVRSRCIKCNNIMDSYYFNNNSMLNICNNNPLCDGYEIEQGLCLLNTDYGTLVPCEKCSANMQLRIGRFGKYIACTNNTCKNTRNILRNGDIAPPKMELIEFPELPCKNSNAYFVLRNGAAGVFLAANTFPKVHETRAPLVEELVKFKDRLPTMLRYLTEAPIQDDQGNKTLVRFSRKKKQQYISSEKEGKATSWKAFFINGHWQVYNKEDQ
ncbi:MAG: DNA topoisomerase, partial [Candidatus Baumannia cicadellinicola]|nr:DNA topoisomerase [Candidatus Baumannia cicadellinicola]